MTNEVTFTNCGTCEHTYAPKYIRGTLRVYDANYNLLIESDLKLLEDKEGLTVLPARLPVLRSGLMEWAEYDIPSMFSFILKCKVGSDLFCTDGLVGYFITYIPRKVWSGDYIQFGESTMKWIRGSDEC